MFTQARLIALGVALAVLVGSFGTLYWWGNSWHTKYEELENQDLAQKLADQKFATLALARQISDRDATLANNRQVIDDLSKKHASDVANLGATSELVNRLLRNAHPVNTASPAVSETNGGRDTAAAVVDDSNGRLNDLLVRTAAEYWNHYRQCSALQAEIKPQR